MRTKALAADAAVRLDLKKLAQRQDVLLRLRGQLPRGAQHQRLYPVAVKHHPQSDGIARESLDL